MWNNQPQGNQPPYPGYPPQQGAPPYPTGQAPPYPCSGPGYPTAAPGQPYGGSPGYPPVPGYPPAPGYPQQGGGAYYPPQPSPYGPPSGAPGSAYPQQGYSQGGYPPQHQEHQQNYNPNNCSPYQNQIPPQNLTATSATQSYGAPPTHAEQIPAMQQYEEVPTINDGPNDPTGDAQVLRKAMKGFGTDEAAIINVLARRTNAQRQQISQAFKASFGKDLMKDLKSELGSKFEDIVVALMTPKYEFLAKKLNDAMSGIGTKEKVLVDILCTATNNDMQWLNSTYHRMFGRTIEQDVRGDTSGHFERLLVSMSTGGRNEDSVANPGMANEDAQKLLQAGEKAWGTDESMFNMILCTRSFAQLRLTFHEYERLTGHSFDKAIDNEFTGDVRTGMMAIVQCAKNRAGYFAQRLHQSLAGFGTKDNDLIFIIVTRAEIDLESIKQEYHRMYGKSLAHDVSGDTGGDYKKMLLTLMGC